MGVAATTTGSNTPCAIESTSTWGPDAPAASTSNSGCPVTVTMPESPAVDNGGGTTCGVTALGNIYCFGDGSQRQIGNGTSTAVNTTPKLVSGGNVWTMVDSGAGTNCGVTTSGDGYCWGRGDNGELGNGTSGASNYQSTPALVSGGYAWSKIALNYDGVTSGSGSPVCGITTTGNLYCWGHNQYGKLGDGTTTNRAVPTLVNSDTWADVSPGKDHTCAIKTTGSLWCWGLNSSGQLGNGTTTDSLVPVQESTNGVWKQVWAGYNATCALQTDNTAYCWGENANGRLGNGTTTNKTSPTLISGGYTWKMVSVGRYAMCGVNASDSYVYCAGDPTYGQLGRGTTSGGNQTTPLAITGTNTFDSVTVGYYQDVCATTTTGEGYCWGANGLGQGGRGTQTSVTVANVISDCYIWGYDVSATDETTSGCDDILEPIITAGGGITCGLSENDAYCWGDGVKGLGDGTTTSPQSSPSKVSGSKEWHNIYAGDKTICAIDDTSAAYCWGQGDAGQIGDGNAYAGAVTTPVLVSGSYQWKKLSVGTSIVCGLTDGTEKIYCWGNGYYGTLGNGTNTTSQRTPTSVSGTTKWKDVAAEQDHACGIDENNKMYCWGDNSSYQLGNGTTTATNTPTAVSGATKWISVTTGYGFTCGIKETSRDAYCWGSNTSGLGTGGTSATTPTLVTGGLAWKALDAGLYHVCGITTTDVAYCWGEGSYGQRGDGGTTTVAKSPVAVSGGNTYVSISSGSRHTCAVKSAGGGVCWGNNTTGQVGDASTTQRNAPTTVTVCTLWGDYASNSCSTGGGGGGGTWKVLVTGNQGSNAFSCGVKNADNTLWCWGEGGKGQLGNGSTSDQSSAVQVSGGGSWLTVGVGDEHTCGVKADGSMWCWGEGGKGQLGRGSTSDSLVPVAVSGGATWKSMVGGKEHSCGIKSDNTAWCWGEGGAGQLGNGSTSDRTSPIAVSGGYTWTSLSSGVNAEYTCGTTTTSANYCWGSGYGNSPVLRP
jgi:alpha-tubulin suppressor-like RCC1 family protein